MKTYEFLSELNSLSGIPCLFVDYPTCFVHCYFGKINISKYNEDSFQKATKFVQDRQFAILKDKSDSKKEMYVIPVKESSHGLSGLIFLIKDGYTSFKCDFKYRNMANLISLFLYGSTITGENFSEHIEICDPALWELFDNDRPAENNKYLTYFIEKRMLQSVRQGNIYTLRDEISLYLPLAMSTLFLPCVKFRHKKNLMISVVTMVFVEASAGGLPPAEGFELLRKYHNIIENLTTFNNIESLVEEIFTTYCKKVSNTKQANYSQPVSTAIEYVKSHLNGKIRLQDIARECGMHTSHLSALFKKEYGINFSKFVMDEKIEEAKKLIQYTDYSISEIASALDFSDQSHFSRSFKEYTDYTPLQFRNILTEK